MEKARAASSSNSYAPIIINYVPTISLLANNWVVIEFIDAVDASCILGNLWTVSKGSLVLSRWHFGFDPLTEKVTIRHLWVLLPAFPFPLWSKDILTSLANSLGRFVALEKDFHLQFDKRTAKVLVELEISRGLILEVDIIFGSLVIS